MPSNTAKIGFALQLLASIIKSYADHNKTPFELKIYANLGKIPNETFSITILSTDNYWNGTFMRILFERHFTILAHKIAQIYIVVCLALVLQN